MININNKLIKELEEHKELVKDFLTDYELKENEVIKNDLLMCSVCGDIKIVVIGNNKIIVASACQCTRKKEFEEKQAEEERNNREKIKSNIDKSLIGDRYKDFTFSNVDYEARSGNIKEFSLIVNRCIRYADNFEEILKHGDSIYFYGDVGTGKTFLAHCIGNELMSKGYTVYFTSVIEIDRTIRDTYQYGSKTSESEIMEILANADLLVIDDIGTERISEFKQEKLYDIINKRYINLMPMIFTSEFNLRDLINKGLEKRTVDRMREMIKGAFKLSGQSYRTQKRNKTKRF